MNADVKTWRPNERPMMMSYRITGVIRGSVMLRNFRNAPAPSISADSYSSIGMPRKPGEEHQGPLARPELGDHHECQLRVGRIAQPVRRRQPDALSRKFTSP